VAGDQRHVRDGLDVLHERGASPIAALGGEGRCEPRQRRPALEVGEHGRLLAGDVAGGASRQVDVGPLAPFAQRRREDRQRVRVRGDVDLGRANRGGGEHGAVEDEVRRSREQQRVLGPRRLALGPVDDDHRAAALSDGGQLDGRREAGPS